MSQKLAATSFAYKEPHLDHYELLYTIGQGSHAKVKLGRHLPTSTQVVGESHPEAERLHQTPETYHAGSPLRGKITPPKHRAII